MALNITGLPTTNVTGGPSDGAFKFDGSMDPAPTDKAMGGTELMRKWLFENVDNDLLNRFQIISSRVRELEDKPRILWLHDTHDDPESEHLKKGEDRKRFDKLVFVSDWQKQAYEWSLGIRPSENVVIKNAISPFMDRQKPFDETIHIIYHTTPHRGLALLYAAFEAVAEVHKNVHLDVYSSFSIYGWEKRDEPFEPLFEKLRAHPKITYHGAQPNSVVRKALEKSHIFAYPSIWPETSCIAAIEAMSAKNIVICPNLAALPETTGGFAWMYPFNEDNNRHANDFANVLGNCITNYKENEDAIQRMLNIQKLWVDQFHTWDRVKQQWTMLLAGIEGQADAQRKSD
jgi:UDP-glucose:(glucosyl)LPS alpha-1,2-glucosyltransferase